ncbi:unnamed protein product [Phytomonas sp. EM1]|nr:unnamed protein product [Phytomonas sp. EM1]|eukprot:CCW59659.1 unnamed protein product [Phytomonas sp. isolate EM1]
MSFCCHSPYTMQQKLIRIDKKASRFVTHCQSYEKGRCYDS